MSVNHLLDRSTNRRRLLGGMGAAAALAATRLPITSSASAQEKVSLSWVTDLTNAEDVVAAFTTKFPNIEVNVERVTFNEVFQQNQTRLGSGSETPDIVAVDAPSLP